MNLINITQLASERKIKATMSADLIKAIPRVAQSAIFSIESNWKLVSFIFKNTNNNKRLVSSFRTFSAEKTINLKSEMGIGNNFELHKIIISKANREFLVIKKNEIGSAYSFSLINDGPEGSGGEESVIPNLLFTRDFSIINQSDIFDEYIELASIQNGNLIGTNYNWSYWFKPKSITQTTQVKVRVYFDSITASEQVVIALNFRNQTLVTTPSDQQFPLTNVDIDRGYFEFNVALVDQATGFLYWPHIAPVNANGLKVSKIEIGSI